MTRQELINRLSYRDQFDKPIVDNVGLGPLLDETIAMLKMDDDVISDILEIFDGIYSAMKEFNRRWKDELP